MSQAEEPLHSVTILSEPITDAGKTSEVIVADSSFHALMPCILPGKRVNHALRRKFDKESQTAAGQVSAALPGETASIRLPAKFGLGWAFWQHAAQKPLLQICF